MLPRRARSACRPRTALAAPADHSQHVSKHRRGRRDETDIADEYGRGVRSYQRVARPDGRVVEVRKDGDAGAARAHGGLRADEGLHALERGGRLPAHEVAAHQRLQLHQRFERAQRLLRLRAENTVV
jgi:hypothetical protein